jgi:pimeloyl-ACP methyl ester carboxylesterase
VKTGTPAIAACALALAVGGCGGAGHPASSTSTSAAGLAGEPAAQILAAAETAIDHVRSFHLQGSSPLASGAVTVAADIVLPGKAAVVERLPVGPIDLRLIGATLYFRSPRSYYAAEGVKGATLTALAGHWVSATPSQLPTIGSLLALTNPAILGRCLLGQHLGTLSVGGETTLAGRRAVVLVDAGDLPGSAPGRLYVAASGPPLPLETTTTGPFRSGGRTDAACDVASTTPTTTGGTDVISRINEAITISAPPGAVSLASLAQPTHAATGIAAVAVRTAQTRLGPVGYRVIGSGPPLVLITGYGGTMESWDPRFVDALAKSHRVVIFDNAGVGETRALPAPLTIDAMADQTSALIDALGLGRADVLGWSMGGMIAEALAIRHPAQVLRLVLCATFPGTGKVVQPSQAAIDAIKNDDEQQVMADLFPAGQTAAQNAFLAAVSSYPSAPAAPAATTAAQSSAIIAWWDGTDPAGKRTAEISVPTLVADGTVDRLDPVSNSHALAKLIAGARLVLYPGAGHAFLFQDESAFLPVIESFLG